MTLIVFSAGILCVLYTVFEIGRLIQSARGSEEIVSYAYDVQTGERIPLYRERAAN